MDKNKDPAFLFYSSDFLTGVIELTMEERGQYITLMCLQHQKGHLSEKLIRGVIPNISDDVLGKFDRDKEGNFFNKRLDVETKKRQEHSKKQRENAMKRWKKKDEEHIPMDMQSQCDGITNVMPLENENENENEDDTKNINESSKNSSKKSIKPKTTKEAYGEYLNVKLTAQEHQKLIEEYGLDTALKAIEFLSAYREEKGYRNKSDYLSIKRWVIGAVKEKQDKPKQPNSTGNIFLDMLKERGVIDE